jgi:hypothetical protein
VTSEDSQFEERRNDPECLGGHLASDTRSSARACACACTCTCTCPCTCASSGCPNPLGPKGQSGRAAYNIKEFPDGTFLPKPERVIHLKAYAFLGFVGYGAWDAFNPLFKDLSEVSDIVDELNSLSDSIFEDANSGLKPIANDVSSWIIELRNRGEWHKGVGDQLRLNELHDAIRPGSTFSDERVEDMISRLDADLHVHFENYWRTMEGLGTMLAYAAGNYIRELTSTRRSTTMRLARQPSCSPRTASLPRRTPKWLTPWPLPLPWTLNSRHPRL